MRNVIIILTSAGVLVGAPFVGSLDPLLGGLITVAAATLAASAVAGVISPVTLVFGALAALSHALLWAEAPIVAGAATFAFIHAGRASRARGGRVAIALSAAAAAAAAGIATLVVLTHLAAGWQLLTVAVAVGALIASTPILIPIDDLMTAELRALARRATGLLRWRLERAVVLRRKIIGQTETMGEGDVARLERAFESLIVLARARRAASDDASEVLDDSIAEHLAALERGLAAIDRRSAVRTGLETGRAEELRREAEEIEAEAEALAEVTGSAVAVEESH